ncbi:monovalent cation/H(+) antiporter subunit G [Methylobacterium oryzae CBMB20]
MRAGPISGIRQRSRRDGAAIWVVLTVTYMVFAGSVSLNEGWPPSGAPVSGRSGGGASGGAAGCASASIGNRCVRSLRPSSPCRARPPASGCTSCAPFSERAGGGATRERSAADLAWATPDGEAAPATRAVGLLTASLAPDSYVLTLDRVHGTVVSARPGGGAMSVWTAAILALLPPLALAAVLAWRGPPGQRFVAYQLVGSVTVLDPDAHGVRHRPGVDHRPRPHPGPAQPARHDAARGLPGALDMSVVIGSVLAVAVAAAWLAALALWRLPRALDRMHAVAFLNVAASISVTVAAFLADGISGRSLKILVMMVVFLGWAAVLSHVSGRAVLMREGRSA